MHITYKSSRVFSKTPGFKHTPTATQESVTNDDILNEERAYKLLEKPYPDGDHLGWHSQESTFEEEDRKETRFPVHGLVKVNGVYL
ncbi:jg25721 [Pararge aegeria aegeria]|uniref:Jg25721 protein n=1 Tax=Pararge aegeria aegeria TaxID=348720 RepID=A0A8S4QIR3_9NEOP|nr:jg25721 [Pararge aegeria aegeria]